MIANKIPVNIILYLAAAAVLVFSSFIGKELSIIIAVSLIGASSVISLRSLLDEPKVSVRAVGEIGWFQSPDKTSGIDADLMFGYMRRLYVDKRRTTRGEATCFVNNKLYQLTPAEWAAARDILISAGLAVSTSRQGGGSGFQIVEATNYPNAIKKLSLAFTPLPYQRKR